MCKQATSSAQGSRTNTHQNILAVKSRRGREGEGEREREDDRFPEHQYHKDMAPIYTKKGSKSIDDLT